jgi:predicted metal-dependent peptidase
VLKDFLRSYAAGNDLSTWRRPSRRGMAMDTTLPSRYSESAQRITIGIDTSGSIGTEQLRRALTEVMSACEVVKPETVDVIYWDAEVAGHEIYEADAVTTLAELTKPKGGGGTDPTCMQRYMQAHGIKPDCIVQFTDGHVGGQWGDWSAPVLWAISTKGITAPSGVSVYVPV